MCKKLALVYLILEVFNNFCINNIKRIPLWLSQILCVNCIHKYVNVAKYDIYIFKEMDRFV
jgi:hypothetical protein